MTNELVKKLEKGREPEVALKSRVQNGASARLQSTKSTSTNLDRISYAGNGRQILEAEPELKLNYVILY